MEVCLYAPPFPSFAPGQPLHQLCEGPVEGSFMAVTTLTELAESYSGSADLLPQDTVRADAQAVDFLGGRVKTQEECFSPSLTSIPAFTHMSTCGLVLFKTIIGCSAFTPLWTQELLPWNRTVIHPPSVLSPGQYQMLWSSSAKYPWFTYFYISITWQEIPSLVHRQVISSMAGREAIFKYLDRRMLISEYESWHWLPCSTISKSHY